MIKHKKRVIHHQRHSGDIAPETLIVERRVISEPDAAVRVTELVLSPEAERRLTTSATKLGMVR